VRATRRQPSSRISRLVDSIQRTPSSNDDSGLGMHYNRGRPHSSLGPGLPEPMSDRVRPTTTGTGCLSDIGLRRDPCSAVCITNMAW
jgi:hypothetical protein